jgi:hypothetical protein
MSSPESCKKTIHHHGYGYIVIIVLYILLAIILGSALCY